MGDLLYGRYCNNRVAVYDLEGQYLREMKGDWNVVHSLQLFEDEVHFYPGLQRRLLKSASATKQ
jgi:hypothetical protein